MSAILDRLDIFLNGTSVYTENVAYDNFTVEMPPDSLSRTGSLRLLELAQFYEASNDCAVGKEAHITANTENEVGSTYTIFRGLIVDKVVNEGNIGQATPDTTGSYIEVNLADDLYLLTKYYVDFTANTQTITKEGFLFFTDDGSGSGGPAQYTRRAQLRVYEGGNYFLPFEDMDNVPLHSLRRKATGTTDYRNDNHSRYYVPNDYALQYQKKELVFKNAQVASLDSTKTGADNQALPEQATPSPYGYFDASYSPLGANQGWTYRWVGSFFAAPDYPSRNTAPQTIENILRNIVLAGDPSTEIGGAGLTSKLTLTFSYTKGSAVSIRDRLNEGMRVTAYTYGSHDITVSDGAAWAGKTSLTYTDVQGTVRSATISSITGNVLTLSAVPTGMLTGVRVYGCKQLGIVVTLGSSVVNLANYTDVVIGGTSYFIREIRSTTTLVLVNVNETGDFTGLASSGTLTYPTIEYTGVQVNRINWDKTKGPIADLIQWCYDHNILPINARLEHEPQLDIIRLRTQKQWRGIATNVSGAVIAVDNADGFIPGQPACWYDSTAALWKQTSTVSLDFTTVDQITFADSLTGFSIGDKVYGNCRLLVRWEESEHTLSLDDAFYRCEVISSSLSADPVLTKTTSNVTAAAPSNSGLPGGSWQLVPGRDLADYMVDGSTATQYLLRWKGKGDNLWDGDPEEFNMTPLPWEIARWDAGMDDWDEVLCYPGYTDDALVLAQDGYRETLMLTIEASADDVALASATNWAACCSELVAHEFDCLNNASQQLTFKCDLLRRFRHIRICVDRPFLYKESETKLTGIPTRCRDVPILQFNLYKKPDIKYTALDESLSEAQAAPTGQIAPYIGSRPFAQLTNKGGTITNIASLTLTIGAGHNFLNGDAVEFWDTSAGAPFATTTTVTAHAATTITVAAVPGGLATTDKVGALRRWLLDFTGTWRDFYAPNAVAGIFGLCKPELVVKDESAQNGWDAQTIAAGRLYENLLTLRDGRATEINNPGIARFTQVVAQGLFEPVFVAGVSFSGHRMSLLLRNYNTTLEEYSTGAV